MKNGRLNFTNILRYNMKICSTSYLNRLIIFPTNSSIKLFSELTHSHEDKSQIVNIIKKEKSLRTAKASCKVLVTKEIIQAIKFNSFHKGNVIKTAEIAGIMAAKKTSDLIPMCHQINLSYCSVKIDLDEVSNNILINTEVSAFENTGVEMEAIVSCSIAASTIYDMCKSVSKGIIITDIKLLEKTGGKSGDYKAI